MVCAIGSDVLYCESCEVVRSDDDAQCLRSARDAGTDHPRAREGSRPRRAQLTKQKLSSDTPVARS